MEPKHGVFAPLFQSEYGYLALLNLQGDDAPKAVKLVSEYCREPANPYPDIYALLEGTNWRPHLVAAVAVIISGHDVEAVRRLWHQFDAGSWVSPQIGVALYLVDPDFQTQSRPRLEAACPVDLSLSITGLKPRSAAGSKGERSVKSAATLISLLQRVSPVPDWVMRASNSAELRELLNDDIEGFAGITERWLDRIEAITRGIQ